MPKKKPVLEKDPEVVEGVDAPPVAPLTTIFNREDLNLMRDKINEIIEHL